MAVDGKAEQAVVAGGNADNQHRDIKRHDDKKAKKSAVALRQRQYRAERADEQERQTAQRE